eukprot:4126303-Pyramimonas_sp.AAC.1
MTYDEVKDLVYCNVCRSRPRPAGKQAGTCPTPSFTNTARNTTATCWWAFIAQASFTAFAYLTCTRYSPFGDLREHIVQL